jgi:hypothetical protein
VIGPVALQGQDQALERAFRAHVGGHGRVGHGNNCRFRKVQEIDEARTLCGAAFRGQPRTLKRAELRQGSLNLLQPHLVPATCRGAKKSWTE